MRRPFIGGNWKMHGTKASVNTLLRDILSECDAVNDIELAVFPPYIFIDQTERVLAASSIVWGAQNVSAERSGAFTGEISATMLLEFGCRYVIVGHSERRQLYGETDAMVAAKFIHASLSGLHPIFCVGETLAEHDAGDTKKVIQRQLDAVLQSKEGIQGLANAVLAYEPVWAIGTGKTATPEQAQSVHTFIRQYVAKYAAPVAEQLRIIYGGSVKAANAKSLFAQPDIDGGLIGGASLDAQEFIEIAKSCKH